MTYHGVVRDIDCHDARITIEYGEGGPNGWRTLQDFPLRHPKVRAIPPLLVRDLVTIAFDEVITIDRRY